MGTPLLRETGLNGVIWMDITPLPTTLPIYFFHQQQIITANDRFITRRYQKYHFPFEFPEFT